jgi:hypothetical protein
MELNIISLIGGVAGFAVGFSVVYIISSARYSARRAMDDHKHTLHALNECNRKREMVVNHGLAHVRHLRERINPEDAFAKAELDRLKRLFMDWV